MFLTQNNMKMKKALALLGALAVGSSVMANTITPTPIGIGPVWTYQADLTSGEIHAGDGFTIYDFGGFAGFGVIAPGWSAAVTPTGFNPWGIAPAGPDNPSEANLTFTYHGPALEAAVGAIPFLPFQVATTYTFLTTDNWTSRDHLVGNPLVIDGGVGNPHRDNILVPARVAVPDGGATAMLLGFGILGLGAIRRKIA
jgi:hypothetical protein